MTDGVTVLIADDEPDLRLLVRRVLEGAGLQVVEEAIDGEDALAKVELLNPPPIPTVMILDNRMPGLLGIEVAERVLAKTPGQRIILFSAFVDDTLRRDAQDLGVRACVSKSDLQQLPSVIAELTA